MTSEEVQSWIRYHSARFPRFRPWVQEQVADSPEAKEFWKATFGAYTLEDAERATDRMHASPNAPRFPADQFRAIVAMLEETAAARRSRQQDGRARCSLCKGDGMVGIHYKVAPAWLVKLIGEEDDFRKHRFHAACDCETGRNKATRSGGRIAVLDREAMEIA